MVRLIAVVQGPSFAEAKAQIEEAVQHKADLLEMRLDLLEGEVSQLPRPLPVVFTLRRKEGGVESERLALFEKALSQEPDYCDIEDDTELAFFEKVSKKHPKIGIIVSHHDFIHLPPNLEEILEKMRSKGGSHYKIAITANSVNDALHLMAFAEGKEKLSAMAMGAQGQITRVLSNVIGSEFCYAAVGPKEPSYGQVRLRELQELYRVKTLNAHTKVYALLGDPVDKSIGHLFHNQTMPKDCVYLKFRIDSPELPLFFSLMRKFNFKGFSVTMPLKEQLPRFLTRVESPADKIGSVNTIAVDHEHLIGYNTDGAGALNALEKHCKVQGKTVAILGAGGSARAIAYEAIERKAKVVILNRTLARAQKLAEEFGCEARSFEELAAFKYDVLINTIPIDLLIDSQALPPSALVMDIVYWEEQTPLLKAAKTRGCQCVGGKEMFEEQARLQQKIWAIPGMAH